MDSLFDKIPTAGNLLELERVVVLTGAGMSAESGLKTFRDSGGIWEEYSIYDVATPEAWVQNPDLVQRFYNARRKQLLEVEPNAGHRALASLQEKYHVDIITQNIDDLHERAGSTNILHLHGELRKSRSSVDENLVYDIPGWELKMGECCEKGSQLRPHVVWFGEMVPMIEPAADLVRRADMLLVVGTSLAVYPAAALIHETKPGAPVVVIDPQKVEVSGLRNVHHIQQPATTGLKDLAAKMLGSG